MATWLLEAIRRTPQQAAAPTLTTLGSIAFTAASYEEELNRDGSLDFSCRPERLPEDIRTALHDLAARPLEVVLYEGSAVRFRGPVWTRGIQGGTLTVHCRGLGGYLRYMQVDADTGDLLYTDVDQWTIAKGLLDAWQALDYGDFGIDTSAIGASGIVRTESYLAVERHEVYRRLIELAERNSGFDWWVDPTSRALNLAVARGADLSTSVHLDRRNITSGDELASVAAGSIASEAQGIATSGASASLVTQLANTSLRATFGRVGISETFDGVTRQTTLDNHAQRMLDERATMLVTPGPGLHPVRDADVGDFAVGDTVSYTFTTALGTRARSYRIVRRRVSVDEGGAVNMAVEFGP